MDRFTNKAREALALAEEASENLGHLYVGSEHILIGLLKEGTGVASVVLRQHGVTEEKLLEMVNRLIAPHTGAQIRDAGGYTPRAARLVERASVEADRFQSELVGTEHLLISMLKDGDCVGSRLLTTLHVNVQRLYADILAAMGREADRGADLSGGEQSSTPTLDQYSRDLTALAKEGKLDPVIGREQEIQRVIQILSRRTKNNPCP
ncbi:MAG: hypothetical protein IJL66_08175 [Lachnospiraceae bacterium]|nr:hypothetical protein [Lachnospiraceae bacterium]